MNARSEQLDQLATALCAAQAEFTAIPKDSQNPFFKSKYAGLAKVIETASPVVAKHGLSVSQMLGVDESGADTLTTWLLHSSGQFIAESMRLHLSKDDAQGHGSAVTYGKRYAYMAVLGLVADEDDDGNKASRQNNHARQSQQPLVKLATKEDIEALVASAKGLKAQQVRMGFAACGIEAPRQVDKDVFAAVPQARTAVLAECLSEMERES